MTKKQQARLASLLPGGKPKHVRIYDNGGRTADRYTVVFCGNYKGRPVGWTLMLHMNSKVGRPGYGISGHQEVRGVPDHPRYSHLGKKISFDDLPELCQQATLEDYKDLWRL